MQGVDGLITVKEVDGVNSQGGDGQEVGQ